MDYNINFLTHVHRNIIEEVKSCKVFLWFGIIKSTGFKFSNLLIGFYPPGNAQFWIGWSYLIGRTIVHLRLEFLEKIVHRCYHPISLIMLLLTLPYIPHYLETLSAIQCIKVIPHTSSYYTQPETAHPPMTPFSLCSPTVSADLICDLGIHLSHGMGKYLLPK